MATGDFYDVTWGRVRLWCASVTTEAGRTQVVHELAEGDDHPVQDRGLSPRRTTCELLFIEMPREATSPKDRFLAFLAQAESSELLLFSHPIYGPYPARLGSLTHTIDEDGEISATAEFIRAGDSSAPTQAGIGTSPIAGEDRVAARAAELTAILAELEDSPTDLPARAAAKVAAWSESDTAPTRQVIADVAALSDELGTMIATMGLEDDFDLWETFKATILLGQSLRAAALAALSEGPKLTSILVSEPVSTLRLAVRLYGGEEAEANVRQILDLNDIRTPAWIPAGSVLTVPVPPRRV